MSLFPDLPGSAVAPYAWQARFRTIVAGPFQNENLVTRATHQFPLHSATLSYFTQDYVNVVRPILEFHRDRRGRYESFSFYDLLGWDVSPNPGIAWRTVFVGIADGTTNPVYTIPARHNTSNPISEDGTLALYSNGSGLTKSASNRSGLDGRTTVTITGTPASGNVITCDFFARRVWNAKFANDELNVSTGAVSMHTFDVQLIEVP